MQLHDVHTILSLASRAEGLSGADHDLDRDVCLGLGYLGGRLFPDWLTVLPDGRLRSGDGSACTPPDLLTSSLDAVELLRQALLPGSRLALRSFAAGEHSHECRIDIAHALLPKAITATAGSEPRARLAATLQGFAATLARDAFLGGEPPLLPFALVDK